MIHPIFLYGLIFLNFLMFLFSFSLGDRGMMTLNLFSGITCYVSIKIQERVNKS